LIETECYQFPNQIASPPLKFSTFLPIYKNIKSNYGKICELDFSGFNWKFIYVRFEFGKYPNSNLNSNLSSILFPELLTSFMGRRTLKPVANPASAAGPAGHPAAVAEELISPHSPLFPR
jgi:hypothetical protein